jgi:hypothetical protein
MADILSPGIPTVETRGQLKVSRGCAAQKNEHFCE